MEASVAARGGPVRRLVVMGREAGPVGRGVRSRRTSGVVVAGFIGDDEQAARALGEEMLGGVDEVVRADGEISSQR